MEDEQREDLLLAVRSLTVTFSSDGIPDIPAVVDASFQIASGEAVGLLGESGCGKTTTALAILQLLPARGRVREGSIQFRGRELLALTEREMEKVRGGEISIIFQEPEVALNPVMRVGHQVAEVIRAHRDWDRRRCREEAKSLLTGVRLAPAGRIYEAYPHQLSGGQRQRVAIAQALACQPVLVLADEPTASLDPTVQREILDLFRELRQRLNIAFLFISHQPAILAGLADRLMVMYAGRIVEQGSVEQVLRAPLHPYTHALLHASPPPPQAGASKALLAAIPGEAPDLSAAVSGCPFESRCLERMEICRMREPLEVQPESTRHVRCFKYGG